jgi:hypothetical protein
MTPSNKTGEREEKAVQALISGILHVRDETVDDKELQKYTKGIVSLTAEDEAAFTQLGPDPLKSVLKSQAESHSSIVETEALAALHRKKPKGDFSQKTEEELKRKREALLAELRRRKSQR